ncbi:MAG: M14 family metallopeptidase [Sphingobium sp.]
MRKSSLVLAGAALLSLMPVSASAQSAVLTTPREFLGHDIGEDYFLANYSQLVAYWKKLAAQSDRARMVDIGETSEGRRQYMMVVSSPANLAKMDRYRAIARSLASAEGLDEAQARALASEGKAIVWIDGGMHAAEVEHAQALIQAVYDMLSRDDAETRNILDNVIILFGQANPDGQELVADWYMREPVPQKRDRRGTGGIGGGGWLPRLYQKYVGHDNNRDFYLSAMKETTNLNRVFYREWFPQIIYNHHQTGNPGTVVFIPPFRDPFNYHLDPLVMAGLNAVSDAMMNRLIAENKPGAATRSVGHYSTWGNGLERTSAYFHNVIGILTEIIGHPNPMEIPLVPAHQLPRTDLPLPVAPQTWHMSQSIDYSLSLNRAILDYAARNRETLLFNIYRMGRNGIERGSRDNWTVDAADINSLKAAAAQTSEADLQRFTDDAKKFTGMPASFLKGVADPSLYGKILRDPARRDARAYVIPSDQADFPTAIKFLNALIKTGVKVERAAAPFAAGGKTYPAGSFVVRTAQAYRPHVLDMFEPQHHPLDLSYPGGPPIPPYDVAGYTLAFQMGVAFDRLVEGFDADLQPVPDLIVPPSGRIVGEGQKGFLVSHEVNDAVILTNRLLKAKLPVSWLKDEVQVDGRDFAPGGIWIPASDASRQIVEQAVRELGFDALALDKEPTTQQISLHPRRVAIVDVYGGLMSGGWMQWVLEQFETPYTVIYPQRVDAGRLERDFDVIILPDAAYADKADAASGMFRGAASLDSGQPRPEQIPARYRNWLGELTADKSIRQIEAFMRAGGSVVAIGSSTGIAPHFKLPLERGATEKADGVTKPLPQSRYYIPGSLVMASVDTTDPVAFGLPERATMFFDRSPIFKVPAGTGLSAPIRFEGKESLQSGWAIGQEHLDGNAAIVRAPIGTGQLYLIGPEITVRGQSHGTFKLLFNALQYSHPHGD